MIRRVMRVRSRDDYPDRTTFHLCDGGDAGIRFSIGPDGPMRKALDDAWDNHDLVTVSLDVMK